MFVDDANPYSRDYEKVNFCDKAKRGVGLTGKQGSDIGSICLVSDEQMIKCYSNIDRYLNAYEVYARCGKCKYLNSRMNHNRYLTLEVPDRKVNSTKYPQFIYEMYSDLLWDGEKKYAYVYFITDGSYVKIGKAVNVESRLKDIQTGNPRICRILCKIRTKSENAAHALERHLHYTYRELNTCGEWFDLLGWIYADEFEKYWDESWYQSSE